MSAVLAYISSIIESDRILVLDEGRVAGFYTHDVLIKNCEEYQEIYYSQFPREVSNHG